MSKRGTLFGFILGAGAVAGVVALSKKTKTIEQLKTKYAAVLNEMKDYADMSEKHTNGSCNGDCKHCHAEEALGKVGDAASVVTKRVHDILSDKEEFDKLINIFKGSESDDADPLTDTATETANEAKESDVETLETPDNSDQGETDVSHAETDASETKTDKAVDNIEKKLVEDKD